MLLTLLSIVVPNVGLVDIFWWIRRLIEAVT